MVATSSAVCCCACAAGLAKLVLGERSTHAGSRREGGAEGRAPAAAADAAEEVVQPPDGYYLHEQVMSMKESAGGLEDVLGSTPSDSFVEGLEDLEIEMTVEVEIQSHWTLRSDSGSTEEENAGRRSGTRTMLRTWDEFQGMLGANDTIARTYTLDKALSILGLPSTATRDDVGARFRMLALTAHPDKGGDPEAYAQLTAARKVADRMLPVS
eukprot:TRINITY_DN26985_c0_g1_i1.p2 TRINITY_DN26985_c0_g1~~TRINITY_DN26985_c0_g1_i1.p2  ORF type:complete len:212 (+),score=41.58 TRINITY_DN26985_c0_g1_i1:73-708(+)